jgi:hypothetical protein
VDLLDQPGLSQVELVEAALEGDAAGMELSAHGAVTQERALAYAFQKGVKRCRHCLDI